MGNAHQNSPTGGEHPKRTHRLSQVNDGDKRRRVAQEIFAGDKVKVDLKGYIIQGHQIEIQGKLGAGAAGQVFRGVYQRNKVALKLTNSLWFGELEDQEALEEFRQEAMILLGLSHPNIVRLYGISEMGDPNDHNKTMMKKHSTMRSLHRPLSGHFEHSGKEKDNDTDDDDDDDGDESIERNFYLVTELCSTSLQQLLENHNGVGSVAPFPDLVRWTVQMGSALCYLHGINVLHMDVKPANVLLDRNRDIKLCDFGLAKFTVKKKRPDKTQYAALQGFGRKGRWKLAVLTKDESDQEQEEPFVYHGYGTTEFLAPEALRASLGDILRLPKMMDVWSFGVVVWMILSPTPSVALRGFYPDNCSREKMVKILETRGPAKVKVHPQAMREYGATATILMQVVQECWILDPAERPTFMEIMEWLSDLEDLPSDVEESPQLQKAREVKKSSMVSLVSNNLSDPRSRADSTQPPGVSHVTDADRIWYHEDEEDDTVMGPFARTEMLDWIRTGHLKQTIKCGIKPKGPFFTISSLGDHVFDNVWRVATGVKYWWYKTMKKGVEKLYGPFSSDKMHKWLHKSKIPWNLQISPASSKKQNQPEDIDKMYFFPLLALGVSPFSPKSCTTTTTINTVDRPSALQVMQRKEKKNKEKKNIKSSNEISYVRRCPHSHLLVYRASCIVDGTRVTEKIRCSECGALQMRRAKVYACDKCKWYLCTDCDRISTGSLKADEDEDDADGNKTASSNKYISRERAHTKERGSRTRSTPKDPNAWYPVYNKKSCRVFFAQPSTRKTSWTFPKNGKLGIPDPPKDIAIASEGWSANGKIQHTNQGNVRIQIVYTILLAGGFREYDCTVTYGFDGTYDIKNSKLRQKGAVPKQMSESVSSLSLNSSRNSMDSMLNKKRNKKDELMASLNSKGKRVFSTAISHNET